MLDNVDIRNAQLKLELNEPVNWGATVPRVSFENLRDDMTIDLYCSRIGSTELRISSDAAYTTSTMCQKMPIEVTKKQKINENAFPSPS